MLLDEPAASLDLGSREELIRLLSGYAQAEDAPGIVMVTHHVEEIPPGFAHALLIREGKIVAAGPIDEVLTSENLAATFDIALEIEHRDGRYSARSLIK